jgi:acetyl-CoA carboxylase, biotin carboxylase subunit
MKKILIANRSEIASRIVFTCKTLGIKTIAIYSEQDKFLPYVFQADENHKLSYSGGKAYLNQDEIISIAKKLKADSIHPGYGFLSENYIFAQKVIDAHLNWIGPNPNAIKEMADKINARNLMQKNKISIIPGEFISNDSTEENIKKVASKINYPIIIKDPLGGGGKGIKKVFKESELISAFNTVKSESLKFSKSKRILIEKYIEKPKHIEIQIAGDGKNFIHLYERECSLQRRHQKIIEESPAIFINKNTLEKMYKTAIKIAKSIKYDSIGTVEFIIKNNEYYFLEMNTRLQVEHSVTEQTTGLDLIKIQLDLAKDKKLNVKQNDIQQKRHSIECRVYSEDPENNFLPCAGKIDFFEFPSTPYSRVDHNLFENINITPYFDPMLAKITIWGEDRKKTINNLIAVLNQTNIQGIKTNIQFLKEMLKSDSFLNGQINTQSLDNNETIYKTNNSSTNKEEENIALIFATLIEASENKSSKLKTNNWRIQQWQ